MHKVNRKRIKREIFEKILCINGLKRISFSRRMPKKFRQKNAAKNFFRFFAAVKLSFF